MSVDVILEDERWRTLELEGCSQAAFDAVMSHFDLTDAGFECCVMGCDDAKIAELNWISATNHRPPMSYHGHPRNAPRKKRARAPIYQIPPLILNWAILRLPMTHACAKPRLVKSHHGTMLHI